MIWNEYGQMLEKNKKVTSKIWTLICACVIYIQQVEPIQNHLDVKLFVLSAHGEILHKLPCLSTSENKKFARTKSLIPYRTRLCWVSLAGEYWQGDSKGIRRGFTSVVCETTQLLEKWYNVFEIIVKEKSTFLKIGVILTHLFGL